jgi:hypothetical protein
MDVPDINTMAPATGAQNTPASGTYGEKADLANLEAQLPAMDPQAGMPAQAPLPPIGQGPQSAPPSGPGGLPAGIMAPSNRPHEPVGQALTMPAPMATTSKEQRIQFYWTITQDPSVSQEFREFAQLYIDSAIR